MQILEKKIGEIKPYEKNAKKHPEDQIQHIANSINQFGFKQPIVIDKDGTIVCGHGRYFAAQKLNLDIVPCVLADDLTDEQIKAFRLADNKVAESDWDMDLLGNELDEIFDIDMSDFGFDLGDLEEIADEPNLDADSNFNYKEQYGVIVICQNEEEQEKAYNKLIAEGYECKVVAV